MNIEKVSQQQLLSVLKIAYQNKLINPIQGDSKEKNRVIKKMFAEILISKVKIKTISDSESDSEVDTDTDNNWWEGNIKMCNDGYPYGVVTTAGTPYAYKLDSHNNKGELIGPWCSETLQILC
jgi:hypothetical protein